METKDKISVLLSAKDVKPAHAARSIGAGKASMDQWMKGVSKPSAKYIAPLCSYLDCSPKWLLDDSLNMDDWIVEKIDVESVRIDNLSDDELLTMQKRIIEVMSSRTQN